MNTFNVLPFSSTSPKPQNAPQPQHFSQILRPQTSKSHFPSPLHQWQHFTIRKPRNSNKNYSFSSSQISSSLFSRRQNRRRPIKPISDQRIQFVIDIEEVTYRARSSLRRFYDESEEKFNKFVSKGSEALEDLRTLVTVDDDRRVIVSCRRSSIQFIGNFILWSLVVVIAVTVLLNFAFLGFSGGYGGVFVRRRDRSLAGKEVVVGKRRFREREGKKKDLNFRVPINPLTLPRDMMVSTKIEESRFQMPRKQGLSEEKKLPKWWIVSTSIPSSMALNSVMNMESQKEADRVMRAISDNRMSGRDITEDDIIQFRQICKRSGARVLIDTANARDSFYRASVDFVLNFCSRLDDDSEDLHIGGEDPRNFVSGIALSIGLDNIRAARIVSAAVAARTRSGFLQAWALEMQGKRVEAVDELAKICIIHAKFPPEESSAEMEMVARGLEKHLRREQREFLYDLLTSRCGAECRRSAAEALGLINSDKFTGS